MTCQGNKHASERSMRLLSVADVDNEIISAIERSGTNEQDLVWDPVYAALQRLACIAELRWQEARERPEGWRFGDEFNPHEFCTGPKQ